MTRTFRFLFRFQWPILALPVCMTAAAAGGLAFGSPDGLAPLFFPFLPRLFPFLLRLDGWQLWLYLDLHLSLGGRRQDFFLTSRALFLAEVLVSWGALAAAASFLPAVRRCAAAASSGRRRSGLFSPMIPGRRSSSTRLPCGRAAVCSPRRMKNTPTGCGTSIRHRRCSSSGAA